MANDRRQFLKQAGLGLAATGLGTLAAESVLADAATAATTDAPALDCSGLPHQGAKEVVRGKKAVASSQHPIVTETMLDVMRKGGNAIDAAVAGMITQATIQIDMTNHTGTVSYLYYDAKSNKVYQLNSMGTLVPYLSPVRPWPPGLGGAAAGPPMACIPGFMPGVAAVHSKFGTKPWKSLVEYAIPWAENGHRMDEFTRSVLEWDLSGHTFFPSMREIYTPEGFTPSVGTLWKNPKLAKTLRRLADEGPEYFTKGEWAQHFVETANQVGWHIKLEDLSNNPPRWEEPLHWMHNGYEVVSLAPPERQGVFCALVLGMLKHLEITKLGHYTESGESLYYFAHALRRADFEVGQLNDPLFFGVPNDVWMSDEYHAQLADIIKRSRPKPGVDLTRHVMLTGGKTNLAAFGWATEGPDPRPRQPAGSCEITVVDEHGNWVQAMDTLQSGGIPGQAVDGVPMYGSHAAFDMRAGIAGWLGLPGSRMRSILANTIVLKDGKPFVSMGSPGNVNCTVPQVLSNVLDYGMDPYHAAELPRMFPMRDDHTIEIETRIPTNVLRDLVKLGAKVQPLPPYDFHMGSYQQAWRDPKTGLLSASTGVRRAGQAGGF